MENVVMLRFFEIPLVDGGEEACELNDFLSTQRVVLVDRKIGSGRGRSRIRSRSTGALTG
jgi:hypothetical protein